MGIQVRATKAGFDGVVGREIDDVFNVPDETVYSNAAWFEATDEEGKKKLADNQAKADYERGKKLAGLARRATDKLPAVEALKPVKQPKLSLAAAQTSEVAIEKSQAADGVLASDLV